MKNKSRMFECPCCDGLGEYRDQRKMNRSCLDPPYSVCPYCNGSGKVDEETLDDYEENLSCSDYEQINKEYADECRWEEQRDIERFGY